jgi:uncharacterized protein
MHRHDRDSLPIAFIAGVILEQYVLPWCGIHGVPHWGRVLENGLRLTRATGANERVVTLFALFHDACRTNEGHDPGHGQRGAELAARLRNSFFEVTDAEFRLLHEACVGHTGGEIRADVTVQTCWDADRLDLARVGIDPVAERLCTDCARDPALIAWATQRALADVIPECMRKILESLRRERKR